MMGKTMKENDVRRIEEQVFRGLASMGKVALFCMGVLAVLALAFLTVVLVPVMLVATILPTTMAAHKRDRSVERHAGNVLGVAAPRKAVTTSRQQTG